MVNIYQNLRTLSRNVNNLSPELRRMINKSIRVDEQPPCYVRCIKCQGQLLTFRPELEYQEVFSALEKHKKEVVHA